VNFQAARALQSKREGSPIKEPSCVIIRAGKSATSVLTEQKGQHESVFFYPSR
jgi:hypothetical protein